MVQMTPGVHRAVAGDDEDQRYVTPSKAILERGAGSVIEGRGVTGELDSQVCFEKRVARLVNLHCWVSWEWTRKKSKICFG